MTVFEVLYFITGMALGGLWTLFLVRAGVLR